MLFRGDVQRITPGHNNHEIIYVCSRPRTQIIYFDIIVLGIEFKTYSEFDLLSPGIPKYYRKLYVFDKKKQKKKKCKYQ